MVGIRRTFEGETMGEALIAMKQQLGAEAVLLGHWTERRGGFFGLGGKKIYVVEGERLPRWLGGERGEESKRGAGGRADVSRSPGSERVSRETIEKIISAANSVRAGTSRRDWIIEEEAKPDYSAAGVYGWPRRPARGKDVIEREVRSEERATEGLSADEMMKEFRREIHSLIRDEIRVALGGFSADASISSGPEVEKAGGGKRTDSLSEGRNTVSEPSSAGSVPVIETSNESEVLEKLLKRLEAEAVEEEIVAELKHAILDRTAAEEREEETILRARLAKELGGRLRIAKPLAPDPDYPTILVAVGPTGVGKTTTLAKLGAQLHEAEGRTLAYVSLDYYRIGAAEQLKTYCDIMEVPFEQATEPEELQEVIERHYDKEFILVDTAGRSPYNTEGIDGLRKMLAGAPYRPKALLMVSGSTEIEEMRRILEEFSIVEDVQLIFTKVDETNRWGRMFTVAAESLLPVSFLTTGQSVPDDILPATAEAFVDRFLSREEA